LSGNAWIQLLTVAALIVIFGCAPTDTMRIDSGTTAPAAQSLGTPEAPETGAELTRLETLWHARQVSASRNDDYPVGPGDILIISVRDVEELAHYRARVSLRGTIELPLVGLIQAAGLSEDELAAEVDTKLQKYMYQPEATVFVEEYHNRAVAVVGAVNRPGLVLLNSQSETILDVITQAGGISGSAADKVILIPSKPASIANPARIPSFSNSLPSSQVSEGAADYHPGGADVADSTATASVVYGNASRPGQALDQPPELNDLDHQGQSGATTNWSLPQAQVSKAGLGTPPLSGHSDGQLSTAAARRPLAANGPVGTTISDDAPAETTPPNSDEALRLADSDEAIIFKLNGASLDGDGKYLDMPMRPGDVLIVPGGGDVMVVGWVHQPGRFQVGSGLTVLGAIGAAGGPMYAAKTNSIVLIRSGRHGRKTTIPIDMEQITRGQTADLPVQANDVIDVPYSGLRIGPYIFYSILTRMGIGGPVIPY
jgi:protein involved in polysaccharide export with SLBB domain